MSEIPPPTVPPATPPPPGGGSYTPPPPPPSYGGGGYGGGPTGTPSTSGDRTLMVVLAYLWILFLIPLLTKKEDPDIQWHAKNGMGITIGEIIVWVAFTIITWVLPSAIACAASTLSCLIGVGFLVIRILCIVKALSNQRFTVPVMTDLGQKINV